MSDGLRIAFYVRNAFQVQHLRPLFRSLPNATWLLKSARSRDAFGIGPNEDVAAGRFFLRRSMERYDAVVSHAAPPRGKPLKRAKFVMVQYGYAKEPYNFGAWRGQAQAIMAYGPYAVERFTPHAPSYAIGNPRWDDWSAPDFPDQAKAALPPVPTNKPVVLYAPTWGDLSSLPDWRESVAALAEDYSVLVKAHHNSVRDGLLTFVGAAPDIIDVSHVDLMHCLAVCDVLVSDYSGAIFDGILTKRPVVLLDVADIEGRFGSKLDHDSLEMAQRDALGLRVGSRGDLAEQVARALAQGPQLDAALYDDLFTFPAEGVGAAFCNALREVISR